MTSSERAYIALLAAQLRRAFGDIGGHKGKRERVAIAVAEKLEEVCQ